MKCQRGAYINRLLISGAKWDDDRGELTDSDPKVLWVVMPIILLKPAVIAENQIDKKKMYGVPTYKTSERKGVLSTSGHSNNLIMFMCLNHNPVHAGTVKDATGEEHTKFWTRRGVAFISQTDD